MARPARLSKLVRGVSAGMPAADAARATLQQRLQGVLVYLPLAAKHPDEDVEHVHQLRVWTRRSTAALDLFQDLLPEPRRRWLRKQLRLIRRAAGAARDLDVMLDRFQSESERPGGHQMRKVMKNLEKRRRTAQHDLLDVQRVMRALRLRKSVQGLIRRTRWDGRVEPEFQICARVFLEQAAAQFFLNVSTESSQAEQLHDMRLEAKRLRYIAEIVAPAFGAKFRKKFYPELVSLQDALGRISDHSVASELFAQWSDTSSGGRLLLNMSGQERDAIGEAVGKFHREWPRDRFDKLRQSAEHHINQKMRGAH